MSSLMLAGTDLACPVPVSSLMRARVRRHASHGLAYRARASGTTRHSKKERGNDQYESPECAVRALIDIEKLPDVIWEPACGPGLIVKILRATGRTVVASDLVELGCPDSQAGRDFLLETQAPAGVKAIVTNP